MYETLYVISNIARWLNIPKIERKEDWFVFKLEARFRRYFVYSFVSSPIDIVAIEILAGSSLGSCYLNPCLRIYSISPILKLQNKISHLSFPGSRRVNADPDLERRITTPILNIDLWTSSLDRVSINLYNLERKLSWNFQCFAMNHSREIMIPNKVTILYHTQACDYRRFVTSL